jgi:histidinol-phosphate phosphatase family protein
MAVTGALAKPQAVLLDKDGTLIEDMPYNVDPAHIRLEPTAIEGLRLLRDAGFRLIVVSNQPGVAHGFFVESAVAGVENRLRELLTAGGVALDGFYHCPHHPRGSVADYARVFDCRKPQPGMLHRAANDHGLDLARSWMVGDILNDMEAGRRAGCRTVLLENGHETEWLLSDLRRPDHVARDLAAAARIILAGTKG